MIYITAKALSISPYISTSWDNITAMHLREEKILAIHLKDGSIVEIPGLNSADLHRIFEAHARFLDSAPTDPISFTLPLKGSVPAMGTSLEHNPEQANLPPLPPKVLEKIAAIAQGLGLSDLPLAAEPHCNCAYCQISRSLQKGPEIEEEVSEEDLKFRNWDIQQSAEKLYIVTNPLDANEYYQVFLGSPVGCTCGSKNCEHIRAVLDS